jgi:hypothetical protein
LNFENEIIDSLVSEKKITLRVAAELADDTIFILKCAGDAQKKNPQCVCCFPCRMPAASPPIPSLEVTTQTKQAC